MTVTGEIYSDLVGTRVHPKGLLTTFDKLRDAHSWSSLAAQVRLLVA